MDPSGDQLGEETLQRQLGAKALEGEMISGEQDEFLLDGPQSGRVYSTLSESLRPSIAVT